MESETNQKDIEKILNYWYFMEFLSQDSFPTGKTEKQAIRKYQEELKKQQQEKAEEESKGENQQKNKKKAAEGKSQAISSLQGYVSINEKDDSKGILQKITQKNDILQKVKQQADECQMSCWGDIAVYVGKLQREPLIRRALGTEDKNRPERSFDHIAMFSFQMTDNGNYKPYSLSLSPILWAFKQLNDKDTDEDTDVILRLSIKKYREDIQALEGILVPEDSEESYIIKWSDIDRLYRKIRHEYVEPVTDDKKASKEDCACLYDMFADTDAKEANTEKIYSQINSNYYQTDIKMIQEQNDKGRLDQKMQDYILALYEEACGDNKEGRIDILKEENKNIIREIMRIKHAPMGKWPSKYMPAFMQQMALNLTIGDDVREEFGDNGKVFSVNGPPGTGKTTMLKEIVADYMVERASVMADIADPSMAFELHPFENGPKLNKGKHVYSKDVPGWYKIKGEYDKLNDYSILVTSCNNTAVENITKELPQSLVGDLDSEGMNGDEKEQLDEVRHLFDPEESNDIYFSTYAKKLTKSGEKQKKSQESEQNDPWGLVSVPLGKRQNIENFYNKVIAPFLDEFNTGELSRLTHLEKYKKACEKFKQQYECVQDMQEQLDHPEEDDREDETKGFVSLDDDFFGKFYGDSPEESTWANVQNPWATKEYNREREKLFYYALQVNKEFVLSSRACMCNMISLGYHWKLREIKGETKKGSFDESGKCIAALFQTLFLFVPVISTTFASVQNLFKGISQEDVFGLLIVDEAGQAQPQMALGALYRSRKALIVGDPHQVEPVVTEDLDLVKKAYKDDIYLPYKDASVSVQLCADAINPFGTYLGKENAGLPEEEDGEWVGCPLLVHRRCISPMFDISNQLSYDGSMKQQTNMPRDKKAEKYLYGDSWWINVTGAENGNKDHYVKNQGRTVCKILGKKLANDPNYLSDADHKLFIISPFTSVVRGVKNEIKEEIKNRSYDSDHPDQKENPWENVSDKWLNANIGTVHKFQGKEAEEVIFLLGCDGSRDANGAVQWVNDNIVNVAVTRAKYRLYVVGDKEVWEKSGCVSVIQDYFDSVSLTTFVKEMQEEGASDTERKRAFNEMQRWLLENHYLKEEYNEKYGQKIKAPTEKGRKIGIWTKESANRNGEKYLAVLYSKQARTYILNNKK